MTRPLYHSVVLFTDEPGGSLWCERAKSFPERNDGRVEKRDIPRKRGVPSEKLSVVSLKERASKVHR